jgi:peptidoglycan hydrolase-like protein with peptidoglycan-binding domain
MKKFLIILALLCGFGGVLFYFWRKKQKAAEEENDTTADNETVVNANFPLKKGSKGEYVRRLQQHLNNSLKNNFVLYISYLEEDGIFGAKTEELLYTFYQVKKVSEEMFKQKNM